MANEAKFTRSSFRNVIREYCREYDDETKYKNYVDLSKSHLNYSINGMSGREEAKSNKKLLLDKFNKRVLEVMKGRKMQSQTKAVASWVFTCPEPLRGKPELEKQYFETCADFVKERYGSENFIDGIVHYDETTPHMHCLFIPVGKSRKTGLETISHASVVNLKDLSNFHTDLENRLFNVFQIRGLGKNGNGQGLELDEFKEAEDKRKQLEAQLADLDRELAEREKDFNDQLAKREADFKAQQGEEASKLTDRETKVAKREDDVSKREKSLKTQISALQDILDEIKEADETGAIRRWNFLKNKNPSLADKVDKAVSNIETKHVQNAVLDYRSENEYDRDLTR